MSDLCALDPGFGAPRSWVSTGGFAVVWLALMLAYSPVADKIATRFVERPPRLRAFRALRESRTKLALGIVVAWAFGGFLEEWLLRGVLLRWLEHWISRAAPAPAPTAIAICVSAAAAGIAHLYQGKRGALIIAQLSVLFGLLFVASGQDLWAVVLCHGTYDTIAFIRFARGKSKYSKLDTDE